MYSRDVYNLLARVLPQNTSSKKIDIIDYYNQIWSFSFLSQLPLQEEKKRKEMDWISRERDWAIFGENGIWVWSEYIEGRIRGEREGVAEVEAREYVELVVVMVLHYWEREGETEKERESVTTRLVSTNG